MNAPMLPLIRRDRDADRPEAERVVAVLYEQIGEINKIVAGEEDAATIAELERLLRRMAAGNTQPAPERSEKPTVVKKKAASASLKTAAKKPAAKKTAAKKTAAKKSATTKSAAKKAPARGRSKA